MDRTLKIVALEPITTEQIVCFHIPGFQRLGTFEISIVPDQDCCQLFTPRNPVTRARVWQVEEAESKLPIEEMVSSALAATETEVFDFPVRKGSEAAAVE